MQLPPIDDNKRRGERLGAHIRSFGSSYTEITRQFAASLGVHSTDAVALMEIFYAEDLDAPLSPARLAERIGLTSGATTALLNRLEAAGYIVRSREHSDRRIVTLHSGPNVQTQAYAFFETFTQQMNALCAQYSSEQYYQLEVFLGQLCATLEHVIVENNQRG